MIWFLPSFEEREVLRTLECWLSFPNSVYISFWDLFTENSVDEIFFFLMSYCVQVIRCFLHNICNNVSVFGRQSAYNRELPVCRPRRAQAVLRQSVLLRSPQCCLQILGFEILDVWDFYGHSALWTELSWTWVLVFIPSLTSEHDLWQINESLNLCKMKRESMRILSSWAFQH